MRIALLAAAAFLLAACTSTPEAAPTQAPETPTTVEQPAGNGPNCANANSSVVGKALGLRLQGQRETVEKTVTTCKYVGSGMPVEVRFTTNATAKSFAALTLAAAPAYAQGGVTSSINGTVTDGSGAVIPGADVVAKNNATSAESRSVTSENGTFTIPALNAGTYTVTVSLQGFKTIVLNEVVVSAGVPMRMPDGSTGLRSSYGIMFLLTVMPQQSSDSSAVLPPIESGVTSTSSR